MNYIGIIGLAGSGKDTFGDMLMDNVGDYVKVRTLKYTQTVSVYHDLTWLSLIRLSDQI